MKQALAERGLRARPQKMWAAPRAARALADRMLWELKLWYRTQQFANGRPWGEQAWWRLECFEAYWDGEDAGRARADADRNA